MASEKNSIKKGCIHHTGGNESQLQDNLRRQSSSSNTNTNNNVPRSRSQSTTDVDTTANPSSNPNPTPNPDYLTISSHLRSSICFGYPVLRGSHTKIVHNPYIFKLHFETVALEQQRNPHSFRRKKDWLGRWTEANIVRNRLLKEMVAAQKKTSASGAPA
ncbi:unnamed protein product [Rotaria sp. Silwood1]|nr:unnamed protein product [Rotaria sp. Silwood1]CAF1639339.1 unnamed protein product [Rotaria sp. Silwood1]CAF3871643.1 unnamed protein product [Rotaria sp. Silwood1]CAF3936665.1 unnamed protein product [Rotaria sp. Silwood1]CAF4995659.1 unnamed protein product [Rotaria sp. Silwood1]